MSVPDPQVKKTGPELGDRIGGAVAGLIGGYLSEVAGGFYKGATDTYDTLTEKGYHPAFAGIAGAFASLGCGLAGFVTGVPKCIKGLIDGAADGWDGAQKNIVGNLTTDNWAQKGLAGTGIALGGTVLGLGKLFVSRPVAGVFGLITGFARAAFVEPIKNFGSNMKKAFDYGKKKGGKKWGNVLGVLAGVGMFVPNLIRGIGNCGASLLPVPFEGVPNAYAQAAKNGAYGLRYGLEGSRNVLIPEDLDSDPPPPPGNAWSRLWRGAAWNLPVPQAVPVATGAAVGVAAGVAAQQVTSHAQVQKQQTRPAGQIQSQTHTQSQTQSQAYAQSQTHAQSQAQTQRQNLDPRYGAQLGNVKQTMGSIKQTRTAENLGRGGQQGMLYMRETGQNPQNVLGNDQAITLKIPMPAGRTAERAHQIAILKLQKLSEENQSRNITAVQIGDGEGSYKIPVKDGKLQLTPVSPAPTPTPVAEGDASKRTPNRPGGSATRHR